MTDPEFDIPSDIPKATREQGAILMAETINIALNGWVDPWGIDSIYGSESKNVPRIEKGHYATATSIKTGEVAVIKYDFKTRRELESQSRHPVHVAEIELPDETYSIYAKTVDFHYEYGDVDTFIEFFSILEDNGGTDEDIDTMRAFDFASLPDDFSVEVYKNLPQNAFLARQIGIIGVEYADILSDDATDVTGYRAAAEGKIAEADHLNAIIDLEVSTGVATIDRTTAATLIDRLQNEFKPDLM